MYMRGAAEKAFILARAFSLPPLSLNGHMSKYVIFSSLSIQILVFETRNIREFKVFVSPHKKYLHFLDVQGFNPKSHIADMSAKNVSF